MMKAMANKQRGVSLEGTIIVLVLLIFTGIAAMKVLPAYLTNNEIQGIFKTIARDPEMQNASPKDIRESYSKRAMMNNISIINPADIEISKDGGLSLNISYEVKIPLVANATLLLAFNPSSDAK